MWVLVLALGLVAAAPRARAQEAAQVDVSCAGRDADVTALELVLRELLVSTRIEVTRVVGGSVDDVLRRSASARRVAPVRVWIDLRGPTHAIVVLVDARTERVVIRQVPLASSQRADEVVCEEVAHIVSTSLRAILAGVPVGVSRDDARRELGRIAAPTSAAGSPATAPTGAGPVAVAPTAAATRQRESPARTPNTRRWSAPSLRVALGYEARLWSSDELTHGAALSVDAGAVLGRVRIGARLESVPRLRVRRASDSLGVVLDPLGARLLATFAWRATRLLTLDSSAGAALEIVRVRATRTALTSADLVLATPRTRVDALVSLAVGASLTLGPRIAFGARFSVDVDPAAGRYVWLRDGEPVVVYAPAALRPALLLYVSGELL